MDDFIIIFITISIIVHQAKWTENKTLPVNEHFMACGARGQNWRENGLRLDTSSVMRLPKSTKKMVALAACLFSTTARYQSPEPRNTHTSDYTANTRNTLAILLQCFTFEKVRRVINCSPKCEIIWGNLCFIHQVAFYVIHMAVPLCNHIMQLVLQWSFRLRSYLLSAS